MREQLFHLSPEPGTTLQGQIREMLVAAILDGHIPAGDPLPSGRKLAGQLGISRNTVVLAYQYLVDEGYLISRERSGYYVNEGILAGRVASGERRPASMPGRPDWQRRLCLHPSAQKNITKPGDWDKYPYPFIYGQFDPSLFPIAEWRECCRQALSVVAVREWLRDSVDGDDPLLIEQLHTRVLPRRGVWASPNEILVTIGAQQALYIIAQLLAREGTVLGMEEPGYADARNIFRIVQSDLQPLPLDSAGVVVDKRMQRCDYVYVTPSHQFPTTVTMALGRREALLRCAERSDIVIIEDDYESETNFVGPPTPALKSLDTNERVIYVSSLSKTLAPGLRLGYMVGPAEFIREARALRRLMVRHPPTNNQRTIALFIAKGHYHALIKRIGLAYEKRWQVLGEALHTHLPEWSQAPTFGGTSYWVTGPEALDTRQLQRRAADRGILIEAGDICFMREPPPTNCFRLGLSSIPLDRIEPGIRQLAELAHRRSGAA